MYFIPTHEVGRENIYEKDNINHDYHLDLFTIVTFTLFIIISVTFNYFNWFYHHIIIIVVVIIILNFNLYIFLWELV